MATKLLKPVRRELLKATDRKGKQIIVTLVPGDVIRFQVKGSRRYSDVGLGYCYNLALILDAERKFREATDEYNQKKKAGYKRLRQPKRSSFPFSSLYFKATKL